MGAHQASLNALAKVTAVGWSVPVDEAKVTTVIEGLSIHLPLQGLIDKEKELARLNKQIEKLEKTKRQCENKLNNTNYIQNAPPEVVAKTKAELEEARHALSEYQKQKDHIASMQ